VYICICLRWFQVNFIICFQYGSLSGPFAPVVDGDILPDTPANLRREKKQMKVKVLAGLTTDEGAYYACVLSCCYCLAERGSVDKCTWCSFNTSHVAHIVLTEF